MRVLIVEDDRELAQSLASHLRESGMIVELGLPGMHGVSLLTHWRE